MPSTTTKDSLYTSQMVIRKQTLTRPMTRCSELPSTRQTSLREQEGLVNTIIGPHDMRDDDQRSLQRSEAALLAPCTFCPAVRVQRERILSVAAYCANISMNLRGVGAMSQNEVRSRRAGQRRRLRRVVRVASVACPPNASLTSYHHHLLAVHIRRIVRIKHIPIIASAVSFSTAMESTDSRKFSSSR